MQYVVVMEERGINDGHQFFENAFYPSWASFGGGNLPERRKNAKSFIVAAFCRRLSRVAFRLLLGDESRVFVVGARIRKIERKIWKVLFSMHAIFLSNPCTKEYEYEG